MCILTQVPKKSSEDNGFLYRTSRRLREPSKLISGMSCTWDRKEDIQYVTPHYVLVRNFGTDCIYNPCLVLLTYSTVLIRKRIYPRMTDSKIPPKDFNIKLAIAAALCSFSSGAICILCVSFKHNMYRLNFCETMLDSLCICPGQKLVVAVTKNQTRFDQTVWK